MTAGAGPWRCSSRFKSSATVGMQAGKVGGCGEPSSAAGHVHNDVAAVSVHRQRQARRWSGEVVDVGCRRQRGPGHVCCDVVAISVRQRRWARVKLSNNDLSKVVITSYQEVQGLKFECNSE